MGRTYQNFVRGISVNRSSRIGVILVTSSLFSFLILELLRTAGILTNAYIGLVTYMVFPLLFVLGLILIPWGVHKEAAKSGRSIRRYLTEAVPAGDLPESERGWSVLRTVALLTLVNVIVMVGGSLRTLQFMDKASFCGTACHTVMNPEWTTYRQSPHARVKCVDCHVGEGFKAHLDSKLNGAWQIISATFKLYERPIPTPVRTLRPARETCEKCHWPDKFHGDRLVTNVRYKRDQASTPKYTSLLLKIGSGEEGLARGSHWHVAPSNEVRYASIDEKREKILWVDVKQSDGGFKRFHNSYLENKGDADVFEIRSMDCVDCHNRATHIYEDPGYALDDRIRKGLIDRSLPYIKREALAALKNNCPDIETGKQTIDTHLRSYYRREHPSVAASRMAAIDSAVTAVQAILTRNIHPEMNITWGSYPSHLGHERDLGCFRCHNSDMVDDDGEYISDDCTLCHSILAEDEDEPFTFLFPLENSEKPDHKHLYLQQEFLGSFK